MPHIHKLPAMPHHLTSSPNRLLFGHLSTTIVLDPVRDCRAESCNYIESHAKGQHLDIDRSHILYILHPSEFSVELGGCFFYISIGKGFFEPAIYIQITYDLYIYQKRFIYKTKTICIQIENTLYTDRCTACFKWNFDLWQFLFPPLLPRFSPLYRCLFGIIPNSSSLLKTFLAYDY